uniref:AT26578p n=1 Tax=Drosophila melanogaster TaxID=7227 RepID=Q6GKZ2_DROME
MDEFRVPKKVNRNVFKAISILQSSRTDFVCANAIVDQVKFQMRNRIPVEHIDEAIKQSLANLTMLGILRRLGPSKYSLSTIVYGRLGMPNPIAHPPGNPGRPHRRAAQNARQKRPVGRLDPWKSVSKILSEDSLSGTEMTKMRKRMRTNTKRVVKKKRIPNRRLSRARKYKETEMATTSIDLRCSESRLGLDNNVQILFGSPGWTYTKPIQSTLVLPDAPLRLDQKANDPETPKTTVLSGNSSSTSVTDVKGNVVKDEEGGSQPSISGTNCRAVPIGLGIRPAYHTSGGESDVENASVVGLCGSPLCLQSTMSQSLAHDSAPTTSRPTAKQSNNLGIQQITECQENDRVVESSEVQETFENNLDKQASQPSDVLEECQSALNYDFYK